MSTLVKPEHNLADAWATWATIAVLTMGQPTPKEFQRLLLTTRLSTMASIFAAVGISDDDLAQGLLP